MNEPLKIEFEPNDVVVIEGVRYACELFRGIGVFPVGRLIRIVARDDDVLTIHQYAPGEQVTA